MGVRNATLSVFARVGNLNGSNEVVCCVTPPLNIPLDFAAILIQWYVSYTASTGDTFCKVRVRRGSDTLGANNSTNGTVVNGIAPNFTTTASGLFNFSGCYADTPGAVAGMQYYLTLQPTTSGGVPACTDAFMMLLAL